MIWLKKDALQKMIKLEIFQLEILKVEWNTAQEKWHDLLCSTIGLDV